MAIADDVGVDALNRDARQKLISKCDAGCRQAVTLIHPANHGGRCDSENASDRMDADCYIHRMDSLPVRPVELVAVERARNVQRRWSVVAYRDLFGHIMIETGWGRIGAKGRRLVRSFADEADALRYVRRLLARRGTAQRRIGTRYERIPDREYHDRSCQLPA